MPVINGLNINEMMALAETASKAAGDALVKNRLAWKETVSETDKDVKIIADREAEKLILSVLLAETSFPVLAEESGRHNDQSDQNGPNWVIDPLDGTVNYQRGIPFCCVSIALMINSVPFLGCVHDFNSDETFTGTVGDACRLNGSPISVSNTPSPEKAILNTGFPAGHSFSKKSLIDFALETARWRKVRMLGSAALSLAYVAAGRSDAYSETGINLWDVAAGLALVEAAGGQIEISPVDHTGRLAVSAHNGQLQ